jgi:hypothetical protein
MVKASEKLWLGISGYIYYESDLLTLEDDGGDDFDYDLMEKINRTLYTCMKEFDVIPCVGQMEIDGCDYSSCSPWFNFETTMDIGESILERFEVLLLDVGVVDISLLRLCTWDSDDEEIQHPRRLYIQNQAAYVIQKACYNWLWNTTTKDGMVGINCRIGLKKCGLTF